MPSQPFSVVIIDRPDHFGYKLRLALPWHEITSHNVETYQQALLLMKAKAVDAVVLRFDLDPHTTSFIHAAKDLGIPVVFSSSSTGGSLLPPDDRARTVSSLVGIVAGGGHEDICEMPDREHFRRDLEGAEVDSSQ
jgi:DNA-binding LacI/PurR family transcriptional regulator